eukprot:5028567-Alexandrium_andersonii.AAC.1
MSASLVGSEMCIRDRSQQAFGAKRPRPALRIGRRRQPLRLQLWALGAPVSYTHLTLPTICSV